MAGNFPRDDLADENGHDNRDEEPRAPENAVRCFHARSIARNGVTRSAPVGILCA
jgi:hypothetical protein